MAAERQIFWTSASAAAATVVAVAISAVVIWNTAVKQRGQFTAELATLNAKVEATNAKIDKAGATVDAIKKINAGLTELQKTSSLDGIKKALAQLESKLDKTGAALAAVDGIKADIARIETAMSAANAALTAKIDAANIDARPTAGDAARDKTIASLEAAVGDIKSGLAANAASQSQSLDAIAKSVDTIMKSPPPGSEPAQPSAKELVVITVPAPPAGAAETTASVAAQPAMSIRFEKIGGVNPDGQVEAIVANLKQIMKGRKDCAISVAGFADTLGSDAVNLDVSRQRAEAVATELRTAFAGEKVQIKNVAWGERRLKVWTRDGKPDKANRRVDIDVDCKG